MSSVSGMELIINAIYGAQEITQLSTSILKC